MIENVITAHGLTKRYGAAIAVDGIHFSVARGEIFGLLGPNGAGKTTCFYMMVGLIPSDGGSIYRPPNEERYCTLAVDAHVIPRFERLALT